MKFKHTKLCICAVLIILSLSAHMVKAHEICCNDITTDAKASEAANPSGCPLPQCNLNDID